MYLITSTRTLRVHYYFLWNPGNTRKTRHCTYIKRVYSSHILSLQKMRLVFHRLHGASRTVCGRSLWVLAWSWPYWDSAPALRHTRTRSARTSRRLQQNWTILLNVLVKVNNVWEKTQPRFVQLFFHLASYSNKYTSKGVLYIVIHSHVPMFGDTDVVDATATYTRCARLLTPLCGQIK